MGKLFIRLAIGFLLCHPVFANVVNMDGIPNELKGWQQWVMHDIDYIQCPYVNNKPYLEELAHACVWPGRLDIAIVENKFTFSQQWLLYQDSWVLLPGNKQLWPQKVAVDEMLFPVIQINNAPAIWLQAGKHQISGEILWQHLPDFLSIPPQSTLVKITFDDQVLSGNHWREKNGIRFSKQLQETEEVDYLQAVVYRKIQDDIPTKMTTIIDLDVSGKIREVVLPHVLFSDWDLLKLETDLPAKLNQKTGIKLQVKPGKWQLKVDAKASRDLDKFNYVVNETSLWQEEVWCYQANESIRVSFSKAQEPLNPTEAGVPSAFEKLNCYRMTAGQNLMIEERSRGRDNYELNQLNLDRKMWLNFSGKGYLFQDHVTGSMFNDWRLDLINPYKMLSANVNGQGSLVTFGDDKNKTGIEVRSNQVNAALTGSFEPETNQFPISGFSQSFDSARTELILPPGYKLFAVSGVDQVRGSWLSLWKLLDIFLVAILAVTIARLIGIWWGLVGFIFLGLSYHESYLFLALMPFLLGIALVKHAPEGWLRKAGKLIKNIGLVLSIAIAIPFFIHEIRLVLHPQLEQKGSIISNYYSGDRYQFDYEDDQSLVREEIQQNVSVEPASISKLGAVVGSVKKEAKNAQAGYFSRYVPGVAVQSGPGLPAWRWNNYILSWQGPIIAEQTMQLWVIPPWLLTLFRLLLVLTGVALIARLALQFSKRLDLLRFGKTSMILGSLLLFSGSTLADMPSEKLLQELKNRLITEPECRYCVQIATAHVSTKKNKLNIKLEVHAATDIAFPMPGKLDWWEPEIVLINGEQSNQFYRDQSGQQYLFLVTGINQVELISDLNNRSVKIYFPEQPHYISFELDNWNIGGVKNNQLAGNILELTPITKVGGVQSNNVENDRDELIVAPTFVEVHRVFELGLDWGMTTVAKRIAPLTGPINVSIPLIANESVLSSHYEIKDGYINVNFDAGQQVVSWQSSFAIQPEFQLQTTESANYQEIWELRANPLWRLDFDGIAPLNYTENDVRSIYRFRPRVGESLVASLWRPESIGGDSYTIKQAEIVTNLGARSTETNLDFQYKSTQGGKYALTIPVASELLAITVDNQGLSILASEGEIVLPITPGDHNVSIRWRTDQELGTAYQSDVIQLTKDIRNLTQKVKIPSNRWILWVSGPLVGPAILYWAELLGLLLIALLASRLKSLPLTWWQWLLLGIGFSTWAWPVFLLVGFWLFTFSLRKQHGKNWNNTAFNLAQLGLILFSVVTLLTLLVALPYGLLGEPDMHIAGNGSSAYSLNWFSDQVVGSTPLLSIISVPMWIYKLFMLVWAIWFAFALIKWIKWVWQCYGADGYWRGKIKVKSKKEN